MGNRSVKSGTASALLHESAFLLSSDLPKRQLSSPLNPPPLLSHSLDAARRSFARLIRGRHGGTSARSSIHDHSRMGGAVGHTHQCRILLLSVPLAKTNSEGDGALYAVCRQGGQRRSARRGLRLVRDSFSSRAPTTTGLPFSLSLSTLPLPSWLLPPPSSCPSVHQPSPAFKTSFASSRPSSRPLITRSSSERVSSTSPGRSRAPSSTRGTRRW